MTDWDKRIREARKPAPGSSAVLATDWDAAVKAEHKRAADMRAQANRPDAFRVDPNAKGLESFLPGLAEQAGDFARGAAREAGGAAEFIGSAGGLLPSNAAGDPSRLPSPERVSAYASKLAEAEAAGKPLSIGERTALFDATPEPTTLRAGPSRSEQLGEVAGFATTLLAGPETAGLRALPALTRAVPMLAGGPGRPVRNLLEKIGEDMGRGTFGQAVGRAMPPTVGAVGGAELAGELTDDSTLAQLAGGLVGGMVPSVGATFVTGSMRSGLGRWRATPRHERLNEALARKLFVKQLGGDDAARRALAEWETIERTFGPDTGLVLGQVSGGVQGGPAASRTRALAAMDTPYYETVMERGDKGHAFVAQYVKSREPQGAMVDLELQAQVFADEQLAPVRQQLKQAEESLLESLASMPSAERSAGQELSTLYAEQRVAAYEAFDRQAKVLYAEVKKFGGVEVPLAPIKRAAQLVSGGVTEAELDAMKSLPSPLETVAKWSKAGKQSVALSEIEGLKRAINGELRRPTIGGNERNVLLALRRGVDDTMTEIARGNQFSAATPEAADAFRGADKFYSNGKTIFDPRGGEVDKLRDGRTQLDSYLSRRINTPQGQKEWLADVEWMRENGQPVNATAMERTMEQYLLHEARFRVGWDDTARSRTRVQKDFAAWKDSRKTLLKKRYSDLGKRLSDVNERARIFDQASDDLGVTLAGVDRHMAGVILGDTPGNAVARVLNPGKGKSTRQALIELRRLIGGNIAAKKGMKRGIYDYITRDAFEPVVRGGADVVADDVPVQLSNAINRKMRDPNLRKMMKAFYTEVELKELDQVFRLSQLANRRMTGAMTRPASKADAAEFEKATGTGTTILHSANPQSATPIEMLSRVAGDMVGGMSHWARGTDPKAVSSIFEAAFVDPVVARRLIRGEGLDPVEWENTLVFLSERFAQRTRRIPAGLVAAGAAEANQQEDQKRNANRTALP